MKKLNGSASLPVEIESRRQNLIVERIAIGEALVRLARPRDLRALSAVRASNSTKRINKKLSRATGRSRDGAGESGYVPVRSESDATMPSKQQSASPRQEKGNRALYRARSAKQDEFYTQLGDISNEIKHYKAQLRGKTVLCNCDDPYESNFFKYFALNFNALGLKKLIATSYVKSPIVGGQLPLLDIEGLKPEGKEPYAIEISEVPDQRRRGATDITDVEYLLRHNSNVAWTLNGDGEYNGGDFRSRECVELLKRADVVITNPPFSLFREYVAQLMEFGKKLLVIGSKNAITYKEIFKLIKEDKLWLGHGFAAGNAYFRIPQELSREFADGVYDRQTGLVKFRNVGWFTNMDHESRHEEIPLYKKYKPAEYPTYDNYDAIEVSKVAEIPADHSGAIGVPVTFLDRYNPKQFEILGITDRDNNSGLKTKEYAEGDVANPGDLNRRGVIKSGNEYKSTYARLIIRRKF